MRSKKGAAPDGPRWALPFLAGIVTAGAGMVLFNALGKRRRLVDLRLIRRAGHADGGGCRPLRRDRGRAAAGEEREREDEEAAQDPGQ